MVVVSACTGDNGDALKAAATLYLQEGDAVADVTYGKGVFWRKIDCARIRLFASDMHTIPPKQTALFKDRVMVRADFTALPYPDSSMDRVIFDPPYTHNPGNHMTDARYRLAETSKGKYHADIMRDFYGAGHARGCPRSEVRRWPVVGQVQGRDRERRAALVSYRDLPDCTGARYVRQGHVRSDTRFTDQLKPLEETISRPQNP